MVKLSQDHTRCATTYCSFEEITVAVNVKNFLSAERVQKVLNAKRAGTL